jgi:plasmid stabilization system protein ParE
MPQGDKSAYTDKQKRKAEHIAEGYEDRGVPEKEAEGRAWATVNKDLGGGNKSGSDGGKQAAGRSDAAKSAAAKKGWDTRRKNAGQSRSASSK